jgi:formylglycine-generating enzyme required for sulfatase activity
MNTWARNLALAALTSLPVAAAEPVRWSEPITGMLFVHVPGGCFTMGTTKLPFVVPVFQPDRSESAYGRDERPAHQVCLSPFWIGQYEVRAADWQALTGNSPPAGLGAQPAAGLSWRDAVRFAEALTDRSGGRARYRLPTEAEWEYACLAGQPELVHNEKDLAALRQVAVFGAFGKERPIRPEPLPVGSRQPNAWGIHDMRGNALEWVMDSYQANAYRQHLLYDPRVEKGGRRRVMRGGSFRSQEVHLRCAARFSYDEGDSLPFFGFRLVREELHP